MRRSYGKYPQRRRQSREACVPVVLRIEDGYVYRMEGPKPGVARDHRYWIGPFSQSAHASFEDR